MGTAQSCMRMCAQRNSLAVCSGAVVCVAVFALATVLPDAIYHAVFCWMPAQVAAVYFGVPAEGAAFALADGRVVAVTRSCGGSGFFAMLCGLLAGRAVMVCCVRFFAIGCVAAWGYTVLVNSVRVVGVVWARVFAEAVLPERLWGAAHLAAGVMVFFPALVAAWWYMTRTGRRLEAGHDMQQQNS